MIKTFNLTKRFEGFTALDNISTVFEKGCVYGLVGSNGSGKSTLLRLMSGIYYADGGEITADGEKIFNNPKIKEKIFFLPDSPYFFKGATLLSTVDFYKRVYPTFSMERFSYLSRVFPIELTKKIDNMSKGMQRQAALMIALSVCPSYLLLDEAFDGLDPVMRGVLKNLLIESIDKSGTTVIIASHNLRELEDLCDHVALIHSGKLILSDSLESIKENIHKVQVAFKEPPSDIFFSKLNVLKSERTGSLYRMVIKGDSASIMETINAACPIFAELIEPSLEEIFIFEMEGADYDVKKLLL